MSESNKIVQIVFYVSLFVIIGLAVTFTALFALYSVYKRKNISYGHEDESLLNSLKNKCNKEYFKRLKKDNKELKRDKDFNFENFLEGEKRNDFVKEVINKDNKKVKRINKTQKIVGYFFCAVIYIFLGFIIDFKVSNDAFFFGNTTYIVIQTGSMETVNSNNVYIKEHNLTNQIEQFAMIGINKVKDKDIQLYDVIAFKNDNNETIVHRVIKIDIKDDKYCYTFRGDANNGSLSYEVNVTSDKIVGKYNGFQNYGLGLSTTYFKSSAGIIALASAGIFLMAYEIAEDLIDRDNNKRYKVVISNYLGEDYEDK